MSETPEPERPTPTRRWRLRFSLLTLVLGVLFVSACGGLWWRWEPWVCDFSISGHTDQVWRAAFSPDGQRIATASGDGSARVWDVQTRAQCLVLKATSPGFCLIAFSPDGRRIATTCVDGTVQVWDTETGRRCQDMKGHEPYTCSIAFSKTGSQIVSSGGDDMARVWDVESGRECAVFRGSGITWSTAFSPDGRRIVAAGDFGFAHVWDIATGRECVVLKGLACSINSAAFSPDGKMIVTGNGDCTMRIWDSETGEQCAVFDGEGCTGPDAFFTPDGRQVVTAGGRTVRVRDVGTGSLLTVFEFKERDDLCRHAAYSPVGHRMVIVNESGIVRLWSRRRPEYWWGIAWLPEFWIALLSGGALLAIALRRLRARKALKREAA